MTQGPGTGGFGTSRLSMLRIKPDAFSYIWGGVVDTIKIEVLGVRRVNLTKFINYVILLDTVDASTSPK